MLKTAILTSASKILSQHGLQGLSARKLAADIGASTKVIYSHFGSMPQLIGMMYEMAFERLYETMIAADNHDTTIKERLASVAHAYRSFALRNKELFELMYGAQAAALIPSVEDRKPATKTLEVLVHIMSDCLDESALASADATSRAYQFWSIIHGPVSLEVSNWLHEMPEETFEFALGAALHCTTTR